LDAYDDFWSGIETIKKMPINDFCTSSDLEVRKYYFAVRKYLNVHELVAIGIKPHCANSNQLIFAAVAGGVLLKRR
jgi:hypothetical protein